jgi:hypothetical protein
VIPAGQVTIPADGLETVLWQPLVIVALVYAALYVIANVVEGRGDGKTAETVRDIGFGLIVLAALYSVGLIVYALIERIDLVGDMLLIIFILVAFFALLVIVLYAVFGLLVPRLRRDNRVEVDAGERKPG